MLGRIFNIPYPTSFPGRRVFSNLLDMVTVSTMPRPCTQEFPRNFGVIDSSLSWTSHNVARPRGKSLPSLLDAQQNTVDNEPSQTSQCEITGLSKRSPLAKSQSLLFSPWLNTSSVPTEGLLTPRQSDLINLSRLKAGQIGLGSPEFKGRNDTQHKEPLEITTRCLLTPVGPPIPRTSMLPRSKTMGSLLLPQQTRDPGSKSSFGYRDRGTPEIPQPEPERHRKPAGIDKSKRRSTTFFSPKPLPVFTTNPRQVSVIRHLETFSRLQVSEHEERTNRQAARGRLHGWPAVDSFC